MKNNNKMFKKLKESLPIIAERLENASKFILMTVVMIMGFWAIYAILWMLFGFPITRNALWILFAQSVLSECLYLKWVSK